MGQDYCENTDGTKLGSINFTEARELFNLV